MGDKGFNSLGGHKNYEMFKKASDIASCHVKCIDGISMVALVKKCSTEDLQRKINAVKSFICRIDYLHQAGNDKHNKMEEAMSITLSETDKGRALCLKFIIGNKSQLSWIDFNFSIGSEIDSIWESICKNNPNLKKQGVLDLDQPQYIVVGVSNGLEDIKQDMLGKDQDTLSRFQLEKIGIALDKFKKHKQLKAFLVYLNKNYLPGEYCTAKKHFEKSYLGKWNNDEEFAQNFARNTGAIGHKMSWPHCHIDWTSATKAIMNFLDVFESADGNRYYFWSK